MIRVDVNEEGSYYENPNKINSGRVGRIRLGRVRGGGQGGCEQRCESFCENSKKNRGGGCQVGGSGWMWTKK